MTDNKLTNNSNDAKYFTITPRLVWALSRSVYDLSLWHTIKTVAGDDGECILSTEDLSALSMMSTGKVSDCRQYLIKAGLLDGDFRRDAGYPQPVWHLAIPDLWPRNLRWAEEHLTIASRLEWKLAQREAAKAGKSLHVVKALREPSCGDGGVTPGDGGVTPGETKKIHKEEPIGDPCITPPGSAAELVRMVFDLRDEYETHHNETFPEDAMRKYPEVTAGCLCGARVTQEMVECPDCHNEVVWLNSRIWRDAFGNPNEASRDTSWQEVPDDFTARLFARLRIGRFRARPQAKKWARVRKTATDAEITDAAAYVIGQQREGGYGGLAHIMNLALKKAAERPEKLTVEEAKPALEEHDFPGATTYK